MPCYYYSSSLDQYGYKTDLSNYICEHRKVNGNGKVHFICSITYLLLLEIKDGPDTYRMIRPSVDKCLFNKLIKYAREDENILQGIQLET